MSLRCPRGTRLLASVWVFGAVLGHRAEGADTLAVCIDRASPTAALDERVAAAVADTAGLALRTVEFTGIGRGDDGLPLSRFAQMASSDCDLVLGFPVERGAVHLPPKVRATAPYADTGFVLARDARRAATPLSALPRGSEIGISQLDTVAGLLYSAHPNLVMHVYTGTAPLMADLRAHRIAGALGWEPSLALELQAHPSALRLQPIDEAHMHWQLVALYADRANGLAARFESALTTLASRGALRALVAPLAVPESSSAASAPVLPGGSVSARPHAQWLGLATDGGRFVRVAEHVSEPAKPPPAPPPPPALYTAEQAEQGFLAYGHDCAMCHGPLLTGQADGYPGPALKGADFADPSYDFHVDEIFKFVARLMPPGSPGSLPRDQYVLIMAYLLQQNGYPAGDRALTYEFAEKSRIPIRYYGK